MTTRHPEAAFPRDRRVRLPGGEEIRVRCWGTEGVPLLLVHGFLGGVQEWDGLPARLAPRFRVAAVDLPGHGESDGGADPERYRVPRVARELGAVQDTVFGGPAWWLGYSMGGRIALAAAAEGIPMRGLLLESASPGIRDEEERRARRLEDEMRARRLEGEGMEAFVSWWLGLPLFQGLSRVPGDIREEARRLRASQRAERMAAWLRGGGTGSQPPYWDALEGLTLPVRLLVGEEDRKFRGVAAAMLSLLPGGSLTVAPGAGHLPHLEAPDAWLAWVEDAVPPA